LSETSAPTDSRLAALCAEATCEAFGEYERHFDEITRRACDRFLHREWRGSFDDARERLRLYSLILSRLTDRVRELMDERLNDRSVWVATKAAYSALITRSPRWEIAESFFNSLTRRVFATEGVNQAIEFVDTDFDTPVKLPQITTYYSGSTTTDLILQLLTDAFPQGRWHDVQGAASAAAARLGNVDQIEVVQSIFYRGRGAYIVGRATTGASRTPIAFCLLHPDNSGIALDALLIGEADLAILFSYTRAYFRINAASPFALVRALRNLMHEKRLADLYNAIGYNRHAKTEFYRDFVHHLQKSGDCFIEAEGARGMVMIVFTLPSYDVVFKLIRDHFDQPKETDRSDVIRRYKLVFEHDRAGRLIEAHDFEHLRIPRDRFESSLIDKLLRDAAATVHLEGNDVIISHTYVERRVRPLNLFFAKANEQAAIAVACDYGQAIKDLAASNIFPGDLLTKNFGLTRRGRVVFYDYDELCFLTDCNFRELPQSRTYEEEISAEPWFSVRDNDIFPEEFPRFLAFPDSARNELMKHHGDLFRPQFWMQTQGRLRAGELPHIFPYKPERRLRPAN
jgi:isocitrate dehydrogenase kinase/phosphatase